MTYLLTVEPGVRGASVDIYGAWCRAGFSPINCHSAWLLKWAVPLLLPVMGRRRKRPADEPPPTPAACHGARSGPEPQAAARQAAGVWKDRT
jgi:hypothetical protein